MANEVRIRRASPDDIDGLARLKLEWARSTGEIPSDAASSFSQELASWMTGMGDRVVCDVAETETRLVGMAWMVVFDRVPDPGNVHRVSADVQSVFVVEEYRGQGIGARLVAGICDEADHRRIPRVLVHSSSKAIPLYNRLGFHSLLRLLARTTPPPNPEG